MTGPFRKGVYHNPRGLVEVRKVIGVVVTYIYILYIHGVCPFLPVTVRKQEHHYDSKAFINRHPTVTGNRIPHIYIIIYTHTVTVYIYIYMHVYTVIQLWLLMIY